VPLVTTQYQIWTRLESLGVLVMVGRAQSNTRVGLIKCHEVFIKVKEPPPKDKRFHGNNAFCLLSARAMKALGFDILGVPSITSLPSPLSSFLIPPPSSTPFEIVTDQH